jgi:hypothetical protein
MLGNRTLRFPMLDRFLYRGRHEWIEAHPAFEQA